MEQKDKGHEEHVLTKSFIPSEKKNPYKVNHAHDEAFVDSITVVKADIDAHLNAKVNLKYEKAIET